MRSKDKMHSVYKNIAWAALLALAAGCTDIGMPEPPTTHVVVAMRASCEGMTRADATYVAVGTFATGSSIGVFGYAYDNATWQTTLLPNFFDNQLMSIGDDHTSLSYSPAAYWPRGDRRVALFGYYPHSSVAANIVPTVTRGTGYFDYETPTTATSQTDFMVSPLLKDRTAADGPLTLNFHHVLACIEISVDLTGSEFASVSSVKVLNVRTKGTFSPAKMTEDLNASSDDWRTQAWTTKDDLADVAIDNLPVSGNLTVSDATRLLLIPQQCYPSLHRIALTLKRSDDSEVTLTYGLTQLWEAGKTYIYKFSNTNLTNPAFHGNAGKAEDGGTI